MERYHDIRVNDKRVLRICRKRDIKPTIKYANNGCIHQSANPQYIAENILNWEFHTDAPNEKWLTEVTEFKYYTGTGKHKAFDSFPLQTSLMFVCLVVGGLLAMWKNVKGQTVRLGYIVSLLVFYATLSSDEFNFVYKKSRDSLESLLLLIVVFSCLVQYSLFYL